MGKLFGDADSDQANVFGPALDAWSWGFIGRNLAYDPTSGRATGWAVDSVGNPIWEASWQPRSLVSAVDAARGSLLDGLSSGDLWFQRVGWQQVEHVDIRQFMDMARTRLQERLRYLMEGDFDGAGSELSSIWWNPQPLSADVIDEIKIEPGAAVPGTLTVPQTVDHVFSAVGAVAWSLTDPAVTDWANAAVIEVLREFALLLINDGEVDSIVEKYRAAITNDYEASTHRAAALMYFGGASNTSPARLSAWRRSEEIERQVAAFRAELLYNLYPNPNSIVGVFQAFVNDSSRIDAFNVQKNAQILQSKLSQLDAALNGVIQKALMDTQASITNANLTTEANVREVMAKVQLMIGALDSRIRIGLTNDSSKIEIARLIVALDTTIAEIELRYADTATQLRRELQVNRLKTYMWNIELSETLMNAAGLPLGVPMVPPDPSKFETRLTAGMQTFGAVAGALAPSGPAVAIGAATIGAAITMFMPSFRNR